MSNAINWFDIPAADFKRAVKFYSTVLNVELQEMEMGENTIAFFPTTDKGIGGCIAAGKEYKPSADGSMVYLNGGEDLNLPLDRVEAAGGKVLSPKTSIGEFGYIATFSDTEGNKVAFHSMN